MPFLTYNFRSNQLQLACSMNVILPQDADDSQVGPDGDAGFPVLYLLHGLSDDHSVWMRRTSIERYAAEMGLAIIMPAVNRSFYTDMVVGPRYWTFISEELPAVCQHMFRISTRREDTFVAGLSMGRYGAFKLAMSQPHRFAAAASLSGVLDLSHRIQEADGPAWAPEWREELTHVFGEPEHFPGSKHDTMHLATELAASDGPKPAMYQCCGSNDFLIKHNHRFRDHARSLGLDLTYHEHPGYEHSWDYWDKTIQDVLAWLPIPKP